MRGRRVVISVIAVALLAVTVVLFLGFDAVSHSNSDTLRPFLITVVPLWVVFGLGVRLWTRRHGAPAERR